MKQQLSDLQKDRTQLEQRLEAEKQAQSNVERSNKETKVEIEKVNTFIKFFMLIHYMADGRLN